MRFIWWGVSPGLAQAVTSVHQTITSHLPPAVGRRKYHNTNKLQSPVLKVKLVSCNCLLLCMFCSKPVSWSLCLCVSTSYTSQTRHFWAPKGRTSRDRCDRSLVRSEKHWLDLWASIYQKHFSERRQCSVSLSSEKSFLVSYCFYLQVDDVGINIDLCPGDDHRSGVSLSYAEHTNKLITIDVLALLKFWVSFLNT